MINKITPHPKTGAAEFPETVRKPVQQEIARCCTYHTCLVKHGNTGLLTCVRERHASPAAASCLLTDRLCNGGHLYPSERQFASARPRAHSTVSCRPFGLLPAGSSRLPLASPLGSASVRPPVQPLLVLRYLHIKLSRGNRLWGPTDVKRALCVDSNAIGNH